MESIEVQFDEFIGLIQQSKESVLSELSTRQQEEMSLVSQTLKELDKKQAELAEVLASLNETLKMEKILALKVSTDTSNTSLIFFLQGRKKSFLSTREVNTTVIIWPVAYFFRERITKTLIRRRVCGKRHKLAKSVSKIFVKGFYSPI